jgi:hypothetical protein
MKRKINFIEGAKLDALLTGREKPENKYEELLVKAYKSAFGGELLISFLLTLGPNLDILSIDEMNMIMIGYSIGQNDMIRLEEKLLATISKNVTGLN